VYLNYLAPGYPGAGTMSATSVTSLSVSNEFSKLRQVIIGQGSPYQRDKAQVAAEMSQFPLVPDTERREAVLALTYPDEALLVEEYAGYVATLERYGVEVLLADTAAAYSFDYTCPRDIGFVIGDLFFVANMAVASRSDEILTIQKHLAGIDASNIVQAPPDCLLEGGDVVLLDKSTVLVGYNQRSNRRGFEFLRDYLAPRGYRVLPFEHSQLHLDCCLNPLGLGHLLIHPQSLDGNADESWQALRSYQWVEVDAIEREYLATNLLSIAADTIIARDHPACARVNAILAELGYRIEAIRFDGVPATGGSFRCASLALKRRG
jgi:N-dimethylarginine dimethylaminohydrolase